MLDLQHQRHWQQHSSDSTVFLQLILGWVIAAETICCLVHQQKWVFVQREQPCLSMASPACWIKWSILNWSHWIQIHSCSSCCCCDWHCRWLIQPSMESLFFYVCRHTLAQCSVITRNDRLLTCIQEIGCLKWCCFWSKRCVHIGWCLHG